MISHQNFRATLALYYQVGASQTAKHWKAQVSSNILKYIWNIKENLIQFNPTKSHKTLCMLYVHCWDLKRLCLEYIIYFALWFDWVNFVDCIITCFSGAASEVSKGEGTFHFQPSRCSHTHGHIPVGLFLALAWVLFIMVSWRGYWLVATRSLSLLIISSNINLTHDYKQNIFLKKLVDHRHLICFHVWCRHSWIFSA